MWQIMNMTSDEITQWLDQLVQNWHTLADLSFSDLLLWRPDETGEQFTCIAQIRPVTGPTALEDDVTGEIMWQEPDNAAVVAYLSEEIYETSENALSAGIPVDVLAIPIMRDGSCIAVLERHTNQMGVRIMGELEEHFTQVADILMKMLHHGNYPFPPASDKAMAPRVVDGMIHVNVDGAIAYATPNAVTAFRRLGYDLDLAGEDLRQVIQKLHVNVESVGQTVLNDLANGRTATFDLERSRASIRFLLFPLQISGEPKGTLVLCRDTTELRRRDRMLVTKDATIREIHHRVKNNLQTVAALLRMQSRRLTTAEGKEALADATRRVGSIAMVHDTLSRSLDEDVIFDDVVDRILGAVGDMAATSGTVRAKREGSFGLVSSRAATSLAMIIAELCQNAVEHGLGRGAGTIIVQVAVGDDHTTVAVLDDGGKLPPGFSLTGPTLGLSIVATLTRDLGGKFEIMNRDDASAGVKAVLELPKLASE